MDRFSDAEVDPDNRIVYWRDENHLKAEEDDGDMPGRIDEDGLDTTDPSGLLVDRRDREHVAYLQDSEGRWTPTRLKRGDDVICGGMPMRVIGPARGRDAFLAYYAPWFGDLVIPIGAAYVTERAPADPQDLPDMPIFGEVTP